MAMGNVATASQKDFADCVQAHLLYAGVSELMQSWTQFRVPCTYLMLFTQLGVGYVQRIGLDDGA
jgi:hypothetical protein